MSLVSLLPEVRQFLERKHGFYIDGRHQPPNGKERIDVTNPANGQVITSIAEADAEDVERCVRSSRKAFEGSWANTSPDERGAFLLRLADLFIKHREELAQLESLQSGKLIQMSRGFEVDMAIRFLRYYAGWATKITGETIQPSLPSMNGERYTAFTRRDPIGVVVGVIPWNFSILIAVWKFASALTTGCTSIIKPSEYTPLTMLRIAELASEAGLPDGVLNVVTGGGKVGASLIAHPGTDKVSFTGSVPTGISIGKSALEAKLTRVTLELGGKNAVGFLPDIDIDRAVAGIIEAGFINQGQICAAGERFYLPRAHMDDILAALSKKLTTFVPGDPFDEQAALGPLANRQHFEKVTGFFDRARQEGDQIICGGKAFERPGYYVEPTLIRATTPQAALLQEETFGPIGTFLAYDDEEELVSLMNNSDFGLSASLWTDNLSKAMRMVPRIRAGTVWVNMHTLLDPAVPFGGIRSSGLGREFGSAFINDYTELKSVIVRY